jgi:hypothetical protein
MGKGKIALIIENGAFAVKGELNQLSSAELSTIITNLEIIKEDTLKLYRQSCNRKDNLKNG